MRGKVPQHEQHDKGHGITPACAGKSLPAMLTTSGDRDHPRMCGEKSNSVPRVFCRCGSPPHVRGKGNDPTAPVLPVGITPACAGKSSGRLLRCLRASGSPPHVRGKEHAPAGASDPAGITPACAGKSGIIQRYRKRGKDHPRMCGEKTKKIP